MELLTSVYDNGAKFSNCKKLRFCLWRIWDRELPSIMFIGLNPSTANEETNDATIRRVISFAKSWGYGSVYMLNCFPLVSTNPDALIDYLLPMADQDENDSYINEIALKCDEIIFAWGNFSIVKQAGRDRELILKFPNAKCLGRNKNGSPKHPLYIPNNVERIKFLNHYPLSLSKEGKKP